MRAIDTEGKADFPEINWNFATGFHIAKISLPVRVWLFLEFGYFYL